MLKTTQEYRVSKSTESIDWESCQTKYSDIFRPYKDRYPTDQEEIKRLGKVYSRNKDELTKHILSNKLKNIRLKHRQVADAGRRRGLLWSCISIYVSRFGVGCH